MMREVAVAKTFEPEFSSLPATAKVRAPVAAALHALRYYRLPARRPHPTY